MIGTSAMYEYAATAIGPTRWSASLVVRYIAVGPSAPPMIPIEPASCALNPRAIAAKNAKNIPSCAAAPMSRDLGLAISGPKSVMAPTPRNISDGNTGFSI